MPLGMEVGFGPGHTVLDGNPAPLPPKRGPSCQFLAHVCCGQTARWIKMPLGTKVDLGSGRIMLHGDPAPLSQKGHSPLTQFSANVYCGQRSPISATAEHLLCCYFPQQLMTT